MRRVLNAVLLTAGGCAILGVVVFRVTLDLSWVDSIYFVITLMSTVGFGDINLQHAAAWVKLFGNFLMVAGPAAMAAAFGIFTDYLLRTHLESIFGFRRRRMKNHIIVCGLGNVGVRIVEHLQGLGEETVVVEADENDRFLERVRRLKVPVVVGDMRRASVLEEAGLAGAKALIAASEEDLVNLEVALHARDQRPDLRVVLRIFDHSLADKIQTGFGIHTAFSTSALAAPAFALAALDPRVQGSFLVGDDLMVNVELTISKGSELEGKTTEELRHYGELSVLSHQHGQSGERRLHPSTPISLTAGDQILVASSYELCARLEGLNTSDGTRE